MTTKQHLSDTSKFLEDAYNRRNIRNENVAVIGGAGFLGSHIVNHLIEDRQCNVLVIDNLVAGYKEFVHPKASFEHHDITGGENYLRSLFYQYGTRYVFNYAAYPYVPDSYSRPVHVCNVNFIGALKVINAAQEAGVKGILQVSSAEVYGHDGHYFSGKIDEGFPVMPRSSYGSSKAAIDALCQVRWREAQTPVIALRQFNCVGERETHPYVITEVISQLHDVGDLGGRRGPDTHFPTVYLGNNSSRDFMYAGDAVKIAVELLERGEFGEVYNLGSEESVKVYDLAKLVGKVMGFSDVRVETDENRKRKWEIWHLQADVGKIRSLLEPCRPGNWTGLLSPTTLEEAITRTVNWYRGQGCKWPWESKTLLPDYKP